MRQLLFVLPILVTGCVNLSGLDAKKNFSCGAPDGVSCMSVSGVNDNIDRGRLPPSIKQREIEEQTRSFGPESDGKKDKAANDATGTAERLAWGATPPPGPMLSPSSIETPGSGATIRVPPKELRIWMAPTEDSDGDLHEQRYLYVVVHDGRWIIDSVRPNLRDRFTRIYPLGGAPAMPDTTAPGSTGMSFGNAGLPKPGPGVQPNMPAK